MRQTIINEIEKTYNYCIETKSRFSIVIINVEESKTFNAVAIDDIALITNQDGSIYLNGKNGLGAIADLNKMNLEDYRIMLYINDKKVKDIQF